VGDVEPFTTSDVVGRSAEAMKAYQSGVLADYAPYTPYTARLFGKLAALKPERLAVSRRRGAQSTYPSERSSSSSSGDSDCSRSSSLTRPASASSRQLSINDRSSATRSGCASATSFRFSGSLR